MHRIHVPLLALMLTACFDKPDTGPSSDETWEGQAVGECDDGIDNDGDGWWDCEDPDCEHAPECQEPEDADGDGYAAEDDCDDNDPEVYPGATEVCDGLDNDCDGYVDDEDSDVEGQSTWYTDNDGDGFGDPSISSLACEAPTGTVEDATDCDDDDDAIHPDAVELCDGIDNDCDDGVDDDAEDMSTWYPDADGDGYGDAATSGMESCDNPGAYLEDASDCDDADAGINPGATEACDGVDNDCDGSIDEAGASGETTWYLDADGDGWGDDATTATACEAPSGYIATGSDCDDSSASTHPGALEYCDGVDSDCDGTTDEDDAIDTTAWYADSDGDGYGDATSLRTACTCPSGYVSDSSDCDDGDSGTYPGATEICDGVDNDCDGAVDDSPIGVATWYPDSDGDGYGDPSSSVDSCTAPSGWVADNSDCDDSDAADHPGATETVGNGDDEDCDGIELCYEDDDNDGFLDTTGDTRSSSDSDCTDAYEGTNTDPTTDCDDSSASIRPTASEVVADGVDQNCDGLETCYDDDDDDGFLDASGDTRSSSDSDCSDAYEGSSSDPTTDCDDTDASAYPGAAEICDGADNDCDGSVDEGVTTTATWYADSDSDGYGDASSSTSSCAAPSGYVSDSTDCDDGDASVNPGASEVVADGVDQNCDGLDLCYEDADGDGYHSGATIYTGDMDCSDPGEADASTPSGDCDDTDATVNPGATEITTDGVDNDCDGDVDEGGSSSSTAVVCADGTASYTSIQDAIDVAADGDVITVCAGTYEEALTISGLELTLESLGGPDTVTIDGDGDTALTVEGGAVVSISGVTLTGYKNTSMNGAAIDCTSSTIDVSDTVITGNRNDTSGSAVGLDACTSSFVGVSVEDNLVRYYFYALNGGSFELSGSVARDNSYPSSSSGSSFIAVSNTDAVIHNNLIFDNQTSGVSSSVIYLSANTNSIWFYNNTVADNSSVSTGTSLVEVYYSGVDLENNVFADNTGFTNGVTAYYGPTVEYNDSYGHSTNFYCYSCTTSSTNIEQNPRFTDASGWDYSLDPGFSPAIDAGNPLSGYDDADGTRNDMGAFGSSGSAWDPPLYAFWLDVDGDGYGDENDSLRASSAPSGYVASGGDCDDSDATVHPGATEISDGVDNECDGVVDDICTCDVCDDGGSPYPSLQDAIDASSSSATITVCGGTWYENIDVTSKSIAIVGTGADSTIIDGGGDSALTMDTATVELSDITLTGTGTSTSVGAAVTCADSTLTATDIVIRDSDVDGSGYIMRLYPCDVTIDGMLFEDNYASILVYSYSGSYEMSHAEFVGNTGRMFSMNTDGIIYNNLFWGNTGYSTSEGAYFGNSLGTSYWIFNNTFADNTGSGTEFIEVYGSGSEFYNNIVADNTGYNFGIYGSSSPVIDYNDSYGHTTNLVCSGCSLGSNNIEQNPRFTDASSGDYSLDASFSPCIDAGNPVSGYNDLDGTRNDMGAFGGPYGAW
jgi:large repetitive protein